METLAMRIKLAKSCPQHYILAINDTMNVLSGKWKLPILGSLLKGSKRFTEMQRHIPGITPRMLSKELKDLEMNGMVKRIVYSTLPVSVEYVLTPSGDSLAEVLDKMIEWGLKHRKEMIGERGTAVHS
ncbi:MAG TPA: helix-turn-helix domain-containing protein [Chitinophaga sp.]